MAYNKQNKFDDELDYNENKKSKKKLSKKDIALDKFDMDMTTSVGKKEDKIPKSKNPFKRLAVAVIPQKDDSPGQKRRKMLLIVAICILIGTLAYLIWQLSQLAISERKHKNLWNEFSPNSAPDYHLPNRVANPDANIATGPGTGEPEYTDLTPIPNTPLNIDFDRLRSLNPDTRAWIKIEGTQLNNVIMQKPGDDNYYLNHDFDGDESISGEIFSTWRNQWDGTDENYILYGHNMHDGNMFAYVLHYIPDDMSREPMAFYKVHPTIALQRDGGESETYKVFAGFVANTQEEYGEVFNYTTKTNFNSKDEFNQYILDIMDRSWFYTDVDIEYGDTLLTLSTCHWPLSRSIETRWVVIARKVRPGESEEVDTTVVERNYGAKLFEYYYQCIGTQWYGSNWDTSKLLSY